MGLPSFGVVFLSSALWASCVLAQPAPVAWQDCTSAATKVASNYDPNARINLSNAYAQVAYPTGQRSLRMTLIGSTGATIPASKQFGSVEVQTTLSVRASVLTFDIFQNNTWFCETARVADPLPSPNVTSGYCPVPTGQVAWNVQVPLHDEYNLTTIITRVRVLDPDKRELICVDVLATPVRPDDNRTGHLGYPQILFWLSAGLAMAYWVVIGIARLSAAWGRGVALGQGWGALRWAGAVVASAISAERLSTHPALLRYATPSWRDVIYHTQWCAALAMMAVEWPTFAYPILSNAAWSTLSYNVSLSASPQTPYWHWSPFASNYTPPSDFADQLGDASSPIFLDVNNPNTIYALPPNSKQGLSSFAAAIGVRPQDLFGICLKIWLIIVAAAVVISTSIWMLDWLVSGFLEGNRGFTSRRLRRSSMNDLTRFGKTSDPGEGVKEASENALRSADEEDGSEAQTRSRALGPPTRRRWWNHRLGQSSFHGSVFQGNLLRLLILFHFPITAFSVYEFARSPDQGKPSRTSVALAALAFVFLSVLVPAVLCLRLVFTPTKKLFDATRTILALGPLYSHYAQGAQLFAAVSLFHSLALGIVIGAGQESGTTQAIVILVLEVIGALATSIWLPWGERASMGIISFLLCVARIITMVLVLILSPLVSVGDAAGSWIAYSIMVIQGIIYLVFVLLLVVKVMEGFVRLVGRVPFAKATHHLDSGFLGAIAQAGWCGMRRKQPKRKHDRHGKRPSSATGSPQTPYRSGSMSGTLNSGYLHSPPSLNSAPMNFLRPEQVYQPYREDADDETGYIMGAWAGGGQAVGGGKGAYTHVVSSNTDGTGAPATSGFSRVRGGKATYEDPFAALSPSEAAALRSGHTRQQSSNSSGGLPPAAMAAAPFSSSTPGGSRLGAHSRMNSHTAPVELYPAAGGSLLPPRPLPAAHEDGYESSNSSTAPKRKSAGFWQRRASSTPYARASIDDDGFESDAGPSGSVARASGNKRWFDRLLNRSEGGTPSDTQTPEPAEPSKSSFVVVRDKRPANSSREGSSGSKRATQDTTTGKVAGGEDEPKSSFVVVRPRRTSIPSLSALQRETSKDPTPE